MIDFEDILCCSICMETFSAPRVLPCQHTFCQDCITSYMEKSMKKKKKTAPVSFTCPLCRKQTEVKKEPFDGSIFPINLTIVALLDARVPSITDGNSASTDKESVEENNSYADSTIGQYSFEQLLDMNDGFTKHTSKWILNPIENYKKLNLKIFIASFELLLCVVTYTIVLSIIQNYDLWLIYLIVVVKFINSMIVSAWNMRQHKDARIFLKSVLGHYVCHIFECTCISCLCAFLCYLLCFFESVRTAPIRRYTVLSDIGHPQCFEDKIFDIKSALKQSLHNMHALFSKFVTEYQILKQHWFCYLKQLYNLVE